METYIKEVNDNIGATRNGGHFFTFTVGDGHELIVFKDKKEDINSKIQELQGYKENNTKVEIEYKEKEGNKTDVLKSIEELNGDNQETETEDKSLKEQYRKKQIKTMKECIEDAEQVANETYAEVESCKVAVAMFEKLQVPYYYWKRRKQREGR